jgi:tRNA1(Val) A37 N6-methylase TrmN6
VTTTPLLSFKDSKPKNVLLKITKINYFIEKTLNAIIIHDDLSNYSKDIENWFK